MSARPLRIGFLAQENIAVPAPIPGASVSRVVLELARKLAPEFDVTVCSLAHPTLGEASRDGVRFLYVDHGLDRRRHRTFGTAIRLLRRLDLPHRELQGWPGYARGYGAAGLARLAEHRPDIAHIQNVSQFVPLAKQLVPGAEIVLHMHCPWLVELPRRVVRRRLEHVSLVLGVSDFIIDAVRDAFPDLADRCHRLHNGVAVDDFPARSNRPEDLRAAATELRRRWGAQDGPVILYVGTMAPIKGIHVLLEAFSRLLARIPDATLVLVGTFGWYFQVAAPRGRRARRDARLMQRAYRSEIEAGAHRIGPRVVLAGRLPHAALASHYAAADVVTMPSIGPEAFGLPVLEAFSSEIPVVASAVGGLPETVHDGVTGRLVPPGDAAALAEALGELCASEELARRMGAAGRLLVEERFTWEQQARRLAHLYRTVAQPESARPPRP